MVTQRVWIFFRGEEGKFEQDLFTYLSVVLVGIEVLVF